MKKVDSATYKLNPDRYELRSGAAAGAPSCPYGNQYAWVGYDREAAAYVRFTKSVFKTLMRAREAAQEEE